MPKADKETKVKEIGERLAASEAAIFADYRGLTVHELQELRRALAESETRFAVVKNTLARLAVREAGLGDLEAFFDGPTAVAFVRGDPVQGAKSLLDVARRMPVLEVKGGLAEGRVLTADDVRALAALESREVMLARLAGLGKYQMAKTAWMFKSLEARFLAVLDAYREKFPVEVVGWAPRVASAPPDEAETPEPSAEEAVPQGPGGARGADEAGGEGDTGGEEQEGGT